MGKSVLSALVNGAGASRVRTRLLCWAEALLLSTAHGPDWKRLPLQRWKDGIQDCCPTWLRQILSTTASHASYLVWKPCLLLSSSRVSAGMVVKYLCHTVTGHWGLCLWHCWIGFRATAESLLVQFKWGHGFLSLNRWGSCSILCWLLLTCLSLPKTQNYLNSMFVLRVNFCRDMSSVALQQRWLTSNSSGCIWSQPHQKTEKVSVYLSDDESTKAHTECHIRHSSTNFPSTLFFLLVLVDLPTDESSSSDEDGTNFHEQPAQDQDILCAVNDLSIDASTWYNSYKLHCT